MRKNGLRHSWRPSLVSCGVCAGAVMIFGALFSMPHDAEASYRFSTKAPYVVLLDAETDTILFEKNADALMIPASMTKIVTLSLLFDKMEKGLIKMDDEFFVSVNAWRKGGAASGSSTMFLKPDSSVSVRDLIQGVIVSSGNDASIVIAENLAEGEETFAKEMTLFAKNLLGEDAKSNFTNATGWPELGHQSTAREMMHLSLHHMRSYPEFYSFYRQRAYRWSGILQRNRNELLKMDLGVDGMKTAHSEDAGYGIIASAQKKGRRLLLVMHGLRTSKERLFEARRLLEWGFRAFRSYNFFEEGDIILNAPVWHGKARHVPLVLESGIRFTVPREVRDNIKVRALYDSPLKAPLKKGQKVGRLEVLNTKGGVLTQADLLIGEATPRGNLIERAANSLEYALFGFE